MTERQAEVFAREWYSLIDAHAPVMKLIRLASEDLKVCFPGSELDLEAYTQWYIEDIHSNFNGKHEIHKVETEIHDDCAVVRMEITWTAQTWAPPAAGSVPVCLKPNVTLKLVPDGKGGLLLAHYQVTDRED